MGMEMKITLECDSHGNLTAHGNGNSHMAYKGNGNKTTEKFVNVYILN